MSDHSFAALTGLDEDFDEDDEYPQNSDGAYLGVDDVERKADLHGHCLKFGDIVIGMEGSPFRGTKESFRMKLDDAGKTGVFVSVMRDANVFHLFLRGPTGLKLEYTSAETTAMVDEYLEEHALPSRDGFRSFGVYKGANGRAEVVELTHSSISLLFPPLWILNQRFYEGALALLLAILTAGMVSIWAGAIAYLVSGFTMFKNQEKFIDSFLALRGFRRVQYVANISEAAVQLEAIKNDIRLNFMFPTPEVHAIQERYKRKKRIEARKKEQSSSS